MGGQGYEDQEEYLKENPALARKLKTFFRNIKDGSGEEEARLIDRVIGDFKIKREIGFGGMATVFEAEQVSLRRTVALKVLRPHLSLSERAVKKFRREAEAAARQRHPGIVSVYAVGEDGGIHYIAQELVEGGYTLSDRLDALREVGEATEKHIREAVGLIADVAEALDHAHLSGVIHRDVKPSNILLTLEGRPKVSDFGLARVEDALGLSRTGEFLGTPYYMSPEQAMGRQMASDSKTDIFSLGVTLYEALTLERPFDGETSHEVVKKILLQEPKNPRKVNAQVDRDLAVVCLKAMEKDPKRRYSTMKEFAQDLRRYLAGEPILARPPGAVRRSVRWLRRNKSLWLASAAALLVIAALIVLHIQIAKQKEADFRRLEEGFEPIKEALEWPIFPTYRHPGRWCRTADGGDPHGFMMDALCDFDQGNLDGVEKNLVECVPRCQRRGEVSLECDAHYLMGLVKLVRAKQCADERERSALREAAGVEFASAGREEFPSRKALIWRLPDPGAGANIRVNTDHFLVHMYLGLFELSHLYLGGEIQEYTNTIDHFEKALEQRPGHWMALTFLGRSYYFFARFYNYLDLAERAKQCLEQAARSAPAPTYHMIYTSLGQVQILCGDLDGARVTLEKAIELGKHRDREVHSALGGIGKIEAFRGRYDEAESAYREALELMPGDAHVNEALAELFLALGDGERALKHAEQARADTKGYTISVESETRLASAYLMCARVHLERGEEDRAIENFDKIILHSFFSPRDAARASLLISTFPRAMLMDGEEVTGVGTLASTLANHSAFNARYKGRTPPVCLSAQGAAEYIAGKYSRAIELFEEAAAERERWPQDVMAFHWQEEVRDLYFLAMIHSEMSQNEQARAFWMKAEEKRSGRDFPIDNRDILKRVRKKVDTR